MTTITTTQSTRPCRPGDVLWRAEVPCGAYATITVAERAPHAPSGDAAPAAHAYVRTEVSIPMLADGTVILAARDDTRTVAGQPLSRYWGQVDCREDYRRLGRGNSGESYAALVATHSAELLADLATVQGVVDRHSASVAAYESACAAAAAAWPVVDVDEGA